MRRPWLLAAVLAGAACEHAHQPGAGDGFARFDADGDGVIEQAEFTASFALLDANRDGRIDAAESAAVVYEADADRDGVVVPAEFASIAVSRLEADANRDGRITEAEFVAYDRATLAALRGPATAWAQPSDRLPESRWVLFHF